MTRPDRPGGATSGSPGDAPDVGGDDPGEVHPEPRAMSPRGGPLGPLVGPDTVRDAVEATFRGGIAGYLAAVRASRPQFTDPPLADFHDWINQPSNSPMTAGEEPRYVILVPGTVAPPTRRGDGTLAATYLVRIQLSLWGKQWRDVDDRLGAYLVAVRLCLLQNGRLDGLAKAVTWRGETIAPTATRGNHTEGTATIELTALVDPVAHPPPGPAAAPGQPDPLQAVPITGVGISVFPEPIDQRHVPTTP